MKVSKVLEQLQNRLPGLKGYVILPRNKELPKTTLQNPMLYEDLLAPASAEFIWPDFPETTASSLCYTSGTTGHPKGVLYSHRSTVLHTMMTNLAAIIGLTEQDVILPVVPMFHVNAWGVPYSAAMAGAKLVLPGPHMGNGEILQRIIEQEKVTIACGVPTIWLALVHYLEQSGKRVDSLKRVYTGGTACPRRIMETLLNTYGVDTAHLWGMTEMSPIGTLNLAENRTDLTPEERMALRNKQGRPTFGVDMKIVDDKGCPVQQDGRQFGKLFVRGYAVCSGYFHEEKSEQETHDSDGWLNTGDIAAMDEEGYMRITDRAKDLIKSGGEWISSIELENLAMSHPDIAEAAVIAVPDEKWGERPLLIAVPKASTTFDESTLPRLYDGKVPDWWQPDCVALVKELPHTATGKVQKSVLRAQKEDLLKKAIYLNRKQK